jgi:hypothetical protein
MRVRLGTLREYLLEAILSEQLLLCVGSNGAFPGQPYGRNVLSPDINDREQLGKLSAKAIDTVQDPDGMPDHLLDPTVSPEDCFGPVPPDSEPPYVGQDPFARDVSPNPGGNLKRGPTRA